MQSEVQLTGPGSFNIARSSKGRAGVGNEGQTRLPLRYRRILLMDTLALWYFIAGGRFSNSILIFLGFLSMAALPGRYLRKVLTRNVWLITAAVVLLGMFLLHGGGRTVSPLYSMAICTVFALGYGGVLGYVTEVLQSPDTAFKALRTLAISLALWALFFAYAIDPRMQSGYMKGDLDNLETLFGVFYFGNNYYTLTYYLLVPIVSIGCVTLGRTSGWTLVMIGSGVVSVLLSVIFSRRAPVVVAMLTSMFVVFFFSGKLRLRLRSMLQMAAAAAVVLLLLFAGQSLLNEDRFQIFSKFYERIGLLLEDVRYELWSDAVMSIVANPLGGGRSVFEGKSLYSHNAVLEVGLDIGIIGAAVYAAALLQMLARVLKRATRVKGRPDQFEIVLILLVFSHLVIMMAEPFLGERLVILCCSGVALSCLGAGRRKEGAHALFVSRSARVK